MTSWRIDAMCVYDQGGGEENFALKYSDLSSPKGTDEIMSSYEKEYQEIRMVGVRSSTLSASIVVKSCGRMPTISFQKDGYPATLWLPSARKTSSALELVAWWYARSLNACCSRLTAPCSLTVTWLDARLTNTTSPA